MGGVIQSRMFGKQKNKPVSRDENRPILWRQWAVRGAIATAFVVFLSVFVMWLETKLVYPTWRISQGDWEAAGIDHEDVWFDSSDGTRLHGWYFPCKSAQALVLYCHGNGEDVAEVGPYMDALRRRFHIALLAFDYRGYGKSKGRPNESGIIADGCAAQQWLAQSADVPVSRIVVWGRSIGGGVAVQIAAEQGARGLILERTFTSLPDVAARHIPWLPVSWLMRNRLNSRACIKRYHGPLLQSHGTADRVVPFELGRRLFNAAGEPKTFVTLQGGTHNGRNTKEFYNNARQFLKSLP